MARFTTDLKAYSDFVQQLFLPHSREFFEAECALCGPSYKPDFANHKTELDITGELLGNGYARVGLGALSVTPVKDTFLLKAAFTKPKFIAFGGPLSVASAIVLFRAGPLIAFGSFMGAPLNLSDGDSLEIDLSSGLFSIKL
jgi:hypothetical protein